jgi:hypothetical protein
VNGVLARPASCGADLDRRVRFSSHAVVSDLCVPLDRRLVEAIIVRRFT